MHAPRLNTLKARLIIIIGGAVVIPLIGAALLLAKYQKDAANKAINASFDFTERLFAQQFTRQFDTTAINTRRSADLLLDGRLGTTTTPKHLTQFLNNILLNVRLDGLVLFDEKGKVIAKAVTDKLKTTSFYLPNLNREKKESETNSSYFFGSNYLLLHATPIFLNFEKVQRPAWVGGISVFEVWVLDQIEEVTKVNISILDGKERKLTTVFDKFGQSRVTGTLDLEKLKFTKNNYAQVIASDDGRSLYQYKKISDILKHHGAVFEGLLMLDMKGTWVVEESYKTLTIMLALIAFAILLSVVSGVLLTKTVLFPIQRLQHFAKRFSFSSTSSTTLDLTVLDFHSVTELNDLVLSFREMARKIGESFSRIKRIHGAARNFSLTFEREKLFFLASGEICKALDAKHGCILFLNENANTCTLITTKVDEHNELVSQAHELVEKKLFDLALEKKQTSFLKNNEVIKQKLSQIFFGTVPDRVQILYIPLFIENTLSGFMAFSWPKNAAMGSELMYVGETLASSLIIQIQNIDFLAKTKHTTELEAEFKAARAVQEALIPASYTLPGIEVCSTYTPATLTGGDWFGFFYHTARQELDIYVADITGHGFPSALLTGVLCGAVYSCEETLAYLMAPSTTPEERMRLLAKTLNTVIGQVGKEERVTSLLLMSLNLQTGTLWLLNGGHKSPLIVQKNQNKVQTLLTSGSLIGLNSNPQHEIISTKIEKGDIIFAYTDGLVENNASHPSTAFSSRKLKELLKNCGSAKEIHDKIQETLKHLWKDLPYDDDVTTLALQWNGAEDILSGIEQPGYVAISLKE